LRKQEILRLFPIDWYVSPKSQGELPFSIVVMMAISEKKKEKQ
jgi:hypothetical protein